MSEEWREYIVHQDTSLFMLLARFRYEVGVSAERDPMQSRVWNYERNLPLHSPERSASIIPLRRGEHVWLPPQPISAGTEIRRCYFAEGRRTVEDVQSWILAHHGPQSQAPCVARQQLFGLGSAYFDFLNIRFANQHLDGPENPGEIRPDEYLEYLVEPREEMGPLSVSPVGPGGGAGQVVFVGAPAFRVEVALEDRWLSPISVQQLRHPTLSCMSFRLTITKLTPAEPRRVTLRILDSTGALYYSQSHESSPARIGDRTTAQANPFVRTGTYLWAWHGYSNVLPPEHEIYDTQRLRGGFLAEVIVEASRGVGGRGRFRFRGESAGPRFLSTKVDVHHGDAGGSRVELIPRIRMRKATQEWVLFALTPLLASLVTGGVILLELLGAWISNHTIAEADHSLAIDDHSRNNFMKWTAILGAPILTALMSAYTALASPLNDEQMRRVKRLILDGLREHATLDRGETFYGEVFQESLRPTDHTLEHLPDADYVHFQVATSPVEAEEDALPLVLSHDIPLIGMLDLSAISNRLPMILRVPSAVADGTAGVDMRDRFVYDAVKRVAKCLAESDGHTSALQQFAHRPNLLVAEPAQRVQRDQPIDLETDYADMTVEDMRRARVSSNFVRNAVAQCGLEFKPQEPT